METLAPLDVFLFWSKCIPEHAVKPPSLATDLVLLNFFRVSRSLANEAVEHILTALSLSLLLLVSGTGIKFQRLICLFPPAWDVCRRPLVCLELLPSTRSGQALFDGQQDAQGTSAKPVFWSGCLACRARCQRWPFCTRVSVRGQDFCSKRLGYTWMLTLGWVWLSSKPFLQP